MIITRSPLRITLGGGGTDLPSYYREHTGFLISAAIDKYVYVTVMRPFTPGIFLKYSKLEHVDAVNDVQHPIIREAIRLLDFKTPQLEITTLADIPAGTGLGSSGSFTTALLRALYAHRKRLLHPSELAELACSIEMDILKEPTGKQDQYIAAYGGITCFSFHPDERVDARPLQISMNRLHDLEDNLLLFFTGFTRSAGAILADQKSRTSSKDSEMLANLHYVKEMGLRSKEALEAGDVEGYAALMHEHWEHKKKRSRGMSNPQIDAWYDLARQNGALGGKLVGAGGGGFLMFYVEDHRRVRAAMTGAGLEEVRFRFDFEGTKVVFALMLPVAVLAGGLATRLGSVTANVPKLLLDLNGRPFADYQLEWMKSEGVKDVVYCLGHLGDQVVETLGDGRGWNMQFRYVLDGPRLLGTGGALQRALPLLGDRFFVLYGDSLLTCNLAEVSDAHLVSGKRCLMTVFENAGQWDASNIVYRDGAIEVYDKTERRPDMRHIDYGLGVLTPAAFASYTPGERLDLATVYQDQLRAGQLAAYEVKSRFYEIGSTEGLEDTRRYLAGRTETS